VCANSRAVSPTGAMNMMAGMSVPSADSSMAEGLCVGSYVRTRKMVNYAREEVNPGETLAEACSDTDVQIVRHTWV